VSPFVKWFLDNEERHLAFPLLHRAFIERKLPRASWRLHRLLSFTEGNTALRDELKAAHYVWRRVVRAQRRADDKAYVERYMQRCKR
jgi:hypothetical protein